LSYLVILLIAISLSMDAFSLAISIGTLNLNSKYILVISLVVGLFHFIMPFTGDLISNLFLGYITIDSNFLSGIIFFYISILMFKDFKNGDEAKIKLTIIGCIIFAFSVSLDSFGVGFALELAGYLKYITFLIFSCSSFLFTFLGLRFGRFLKSIVGDYSVLIGAIIMCVLSIVNICHFLL